MNYTSLQISISYPDVCGRSAGGALGEHLAKGLVVVEHVLELDERLERAHQLAHIHELRVLLARHITAAAAAAVVVVVVVAASPVACSVAAAAAAAAAARHVVDEYGVSERVRIGREYSRVEAVEQGLGQAYAFQQFADRLIVDKERTRRRRSTRTIRRREGRSGGGGGSGCHEHERVETATGGAR